MIWKQNSIVTALAPMRDISTRAFCDLFLRYGEPDLYVTEFLRVPRCFGYRSQHADQLPEYTLDFRPTSGKGTR